MFGAFYLFSCLQNINCVEDPQTLCHRRFKIERDLAKKGQLKILIR